MQIHRFGDKVAIYLGNGGVSSQNLPLTHVPTVYVTPEQADALARALTGCADDILTRNFSNSQFGTIQVR